ncbi:hypothetical protein FRC00_001304, partial [Tulasnella sp. 408]
MVAALSGACAVTSTGAQGAGSKSGPIGGRQNRHVVQMIANASLDVIEEKIKTNGVMYLKSVEKFNEWLISAFVTPGNETLFHAINPYDQHFMLDMKFILLRESKNDHGIKSFFMDVWENYVK